MVGLVLPAAGRGQRFGSAENKLWSTIDGCSVLAWTIKVFQNHPEICDIVVVAAPHELDRVEEECGPFSKVALVVAGGDSRQESVRLGLEALPARCEIVLVHDAARPAVSPDLISRIIDQTSKTGAAIPGLRISDSIKFVDVSSTITSSIDRETLRLVQTPQGCRRDWLDEAYARISMATILTDESSLLELAGYPVHVVEGESSNVKITHAEDLMSAAEMMGLSRRHEVRTGMGYDVHSFVEGRELWLGGIKIPHDRGLLGHSDADVLLHAVCDALLGAAGMGDIGVLFPDTDPAHKNRASIEFLHEVQLRLCASKWTIVNVDVALLAEEPKVMPFRLAIVEAISTALRIKPDAVNIKATTAEKMGFVGRKEGIACWAIATIQK